MFGQNNKNVEDGNLILSILVRSARYSVLGAAGGGVQATVGGVLSARCAVLINDGSFILVTALLNG